MATIREVSRMAGVSISTVSRVLNQSGPVSRATQRRVLAAVEHLGYRPNTFARGLITKRSGGIGATVTDLSDPFFGLMLKGIEGRIEQEGMHVIVTDGHGRVDAERESVEFLRRHHADAIIAYVQQVADHEIAAWDRPERPIVVIARYVPDCRAAACTSTTSPAASSPPATCWSRGTRASPTCRVRWPWSTHGTGSRATDVRSSAPASRSIPISSSRGTSPPRAARWPCSVCGPAG